VTYPKKDKKKELFKALRRSQKGYVTMEKITSKQHESQTSMTLDEIVKQGAVKMLKDALEMEVKLYLDRHKEDRDEIGRSLVTRNGHGKERRITTGAGELKIQAPRVNDQRFDEEGNRCRYKSSIIPPYLRRTKNLEELFPVLYLKGISTGDFSEALESLLGKDVIGLSASNITRLKRVWEIEYEGWSRRDLSLKRYVYVWADGIYFNVRLDDERLCILVLMGATENGTKELIGVWDGYRESKESWGLGLRDLKHRGLRYAPSVAVGDGALGFWAALREEWPETKEQRCWKHKSCNVLDKLPQSLQGRAKSMLKDIYQAEGCEIARIAMNRFQEEFGRRYEAAVKCLIKDQEELLCFYNFPAEHWKHLRTTNPIESTFATVRLRTKKTKGCGSRIATMTMVFKLVQSAQKRWQKLHSCKLILKVIKGCKFKDGILIDEKAA